MPRKLLLCWRVMRILILLAASLSLCAQTPDLIALGLEATQAVQDLNQSVRLVAGKRTFVRFYVKTSQESQFATASLTATRGDQRITLAPINPGAEIQVMANPSRTIRDHAFLFELPDGYRQGVVALEAMVNPNGDVEEPNATNNNSQLELNFETVPNLNLVLYGITYTGEDGTTYVTDEKEMRQMVNWMARAWPVSNIRFWIRREDVTNSLGEGLPTCRQVNQLLNAKRKADLQSPGSKIPANARYYGMVTDKGGFMRGCADGLPGFASSGPTGVPRGSATSLLGWDTDGSYGDWYGSHEVAHNFARFHAEFCNAAAGRPFPNSGGRISPTSTGASAVMGFDSGTQRVLNPNWTDNMAYCAYQWLSPFTYHGLMDAIQNNVLPVARNAAKERARAAGTLVNRLLVVGSIDVTKPGVPVAQLSPIYLLRDAFEPEERVPGNYAIVLKNGDRELARYPFTPTTMASGAGQNADEPELDLLSIAELVPYVDGTTQVDVTGPGGGLLANVKAGAAFPLVSVVKPAGGEVLDGNQVEVSWTASDPDGDKLAYTVQYSADNGINWETVEQDVTKTTVKIDRYDLSGSDSARFRVLATDGIHTTIGESKNFKLTGRSATVEILNPRNDEAHVKGETIAFESYAYDFDAGEVDDESVTWSSNIDGKLGKGLELETSSLSVGDHTITVTVADDAGGSPTTAQLQVKVVAKKEDLPIVPDQLLVDPETLLMSGAEPLSALFEVDNRNSRKALAWTATANQPWIKLDKTFGKTPEVVTVTLQGLPAGSAAEGAITVLSANGDKATVRLQFQK